jgi:hypothetical protein
VQWLCSATGCCLSWNVPVFINLHVALHCDHRTLDAAKQLAVPIGAPKKRPVNQPALRPRGRCLALSRMPKVLYKGAKMSLGRISRAVTSSAIYSRTGTLLCQRQSQRPCQRLFRRTYGALLRLPQGPRCARHRRCEHIASTIGPVATRRIDRQPFCRVPSSRSREGGALGGWNKSTSKLAARPLQYGC